MHLKPLRDELQFPEDPSVDQDTKSLICGVSIMRWFTLRPDHQYQNDSFFKGIPL